MKCKKEIMGLAALLIMVFHFWIPFTSSVVETTFYKSAYVGVDIFFFISACSFGRKEEVRFKEFIINRLGKVYLPFAAITLICAIYKHWRFKRLILVLSGIEFFTKGGGAFLWYVIAIILFYLCVPMLVKLKRQHGIKLLIALIVLWIIVVAVLQYVFNYTDIFIFLNRIPIIAIGLFYEDFRDAFSRKMRIISTTAGLIIGAFLLYKYCANVRLSKPITDIYYICAIPFVVSLIHTADISLIHTADIVLKKRCGIDKLLKFVGGLSLELYGLQMVFGYDVETAVLKYLLKLDMSMILKKFCAFLCTVIFLIVISWIFSKLEKFVSNSVIEIKRRKV